LNNSIRLIRQTDAGDLGAYAGAAVFMVYDSWIEAQAGQNHHLFQRRTGAWPSHGLPGKLRMSTTTPLSRVVATLTL
jgi:hypothetical protein